MKSKVTIIISFVMSVILLLFFSQEGAVAALVLTTLTIIVYFTNRYLTNYVDNKLILAGIMTLSRFFIISGTYILCIYFSKFYTDKIKLLILLFVVFIFNTVHEALTLKNEKG
ncbi:MAG: hypothetical protein JXR48_16690 [Candidatus Delongbacteria bacterium]|nr:hypothetical protein [Candidatus Delongbacteria bacterium]MBN2836595.1 hypothetical protein [Candidatus Delongbacteria bacterium]